MSDVNIEEMDLDSMSLEEMESLMDNIDGKSVSENKAQTEDVQPSDKDDSIKSSEGLEESIQEESVQEEESTDQDTKSETTQEVDEESDVEPQYRGKSKEDILEMQRNANRKISQQNNEIYHLKKKLEEIADAQNKQKEQKQESLDDDLLSEYNPDDRKAINLLIEKALKQREDAVAQRKAVEAEKAMSEHDQIWENLKLFNPNLYADVKDEAIELMKKDQANTYHKQGWMKQFLSERINGTGKAKPESKPKIKKKVVTVSSGGVGNSSRINKSVDDMSAEEYLKHMESQGYKI